MAMRMTTDKQNELLAKNLPKLEGKPSAAKALFPHLPSSVKPEKPWVRQSTNQTKPKR
jgi:hypothetical protein